MYPKQLQVENGDVIFCLERNVKFEPAIFQWCTTPNVLRCSFVTATAFCTDLLQDTDIFLVRIRVWQAINFVSVFPKSSSKEWGGGGEVSAAQRASEYSTMTKCFAPSTAYYLCFIQ